MRARGSRPPARRSAACPPFPGTASGIRFVTVVRTRHGSVPRSAATAARELSGTVTRAAADTSNDQRTGQSYYLVRISINPGEAERLDGARLTPGMPVEAFIQTGQRALVAYLVKPLHDQLMRSLREK
jgi:multidrug efflux pump subunit AcrA (membrane-fusion protein)